MVTSDDVWVIGTTHSISQTNMRSVLWNWNGSTWVRHPLPVAGADRVSAVPVTADSARSVWIGGGSTGKNPATYFRARPSSDCDVPVTATCQ